MKAVNQCGPYARVPVATRTWRFAARPVSMCKQFRRASFLIGLVAAAVATGACSSGHLSAQQVAAKKDCAAVADAYKQGLLPGGGSEQVETFDAGLVQIPVVVTDSHGVPVRPTAQSVKANQPYLRLSLDMTEVGTPAAVSESQLKGDCAAAHAGW